MLNFGLEGYESRASLALKLYNVIASIYRAIIHLYCWFSQLYFFPLFVLFCLVTADVDICPPYTL
jgi:hypothetical protein